MALNIADNEASKFEGFAKKGAFLAVLFFALLSLIALDHDLKVEEDSGVYISLAKSLSVGHGYRDIYYAENPPHTKYPPVFSLLLAPLISFLGLNFLAMKLLVVVMGILALYVIYVFHRAVADSLITSLVVIFTATSHGIVFYSQSIMTEIPYLLLSLLALFWLLRCSSQGTWSGKAAALTVILIPLVYLTRLVGLSLLLAAVAYLLFESPGGPGVRTKRAVTIGGIAAVPALGWFLRNWWLGNSAGPSYWGGGYANVVYGSPYATERVLTLVNLKKYILAHARVIFFDFPWMSATLLPMLLTLVIFAGFIWCAIRRRTILEYYVLVYMGALLAFPGTRPQRYLVPLIPFIWYYFFTATSRILSWLCRKARFFDPSRERQAVLTGMLVLFLALLISNGWTAVVGNVVYGGREGYYHVIGEDEYKNVALWAKTHTPPDSVFIWAKPALRYLWSARHAADVRTRSEEDALRYIRTRKVDHVVVDSFSERERNPRLVEKYPDYFRLVYANGVSKVYKVTYPK